MTPTTTTTAVPEPARRRLLGGAATAPFAALALWWAARTPATGPAGRPDAAVEPARPRSYHLSDHIRRYYDRARY
jgi:hypothetical protein